MDEAQIPDDMSLALVEFQTRAMQIVSRFLAHHIAAQDTPQYIYHYTTDVGLRGILETGQIWLSDIFNLNDPSELSHGFSHAVQILNAKADSGPDYLKSFAKHFAEFYEKGMQGSAHYFVCSFSTDNQDLGQWRAYADNGRGYVLGFDGKALEDAFAKENGAPIPNNSAFPVTYNDAILIALHQRLIDIA